MSVQNERLAIKLPKHAAGLSLSHNEQRSSYLSVQTYLASFKELKSEPSWQSAKHRQRSIDADEIWELYWHPDSPVGSMFIAAPTLKELMQFATTFETETFEF